MRGSSDEAIGCREGRRSEEIRDQVLQDDECKLPIHFASTKLIILKENMRKILDEQPLFQAGKKEEVKALVKKFDHDKLVKFMDDYMQGP